VDKRLLMGGVSMPLPVILRGGSHTGHKVTAGNALVTDRERQAVLMRETMRNVQRGNQWREEG